MPAVTVMPKRYPVWRAARSAVVAALSVGDRASLGRYLTESGWLASARSGRCVDSAGQALPWYTYPAIHFLEQRVPGDAVVLEWGTGSSTKWWARHAAKVVAVEHDPDWYREVSEDLPANAEVLLRSGTAPDSYVGAAGGSGAFDVVVVDGSFRLECLAAAPALLTERGVIVLDNSERVEYRPAVAALAAAGFLELPFWGHGALNWFQWQTSVFYRPGNLLGI